MSRVTEARTEEVRRGLQRASRRARGAERSALERAMKEGVVLRLVPGKSLDLLARETEQSAERTSAWRDGFLAAGRDGPKARPASVEDVLSGTRRARPASCRWKLTSSTRCWNARGPCVAEALQ